MSTVTTTRPIDLSQLAAEVGSDALSMSDDGTERTITCDAVDVATLQAAVDAHTPAPPPPSEDARLQAQIDDLTDIILTM